MKLRRTLLLTAISALAAAPAIPQNQPGPAEREVFSAAAQEADPAKKLSLLSQWSEQFPDSAFARERNLHYLSCYSQLEAAAVAPGAADPALTLGERAATVMVTRAEDLFAVAMRPDAVSAANWITARAEALRQAHFVLAQLASNRRNYSRAEAEFRLLLPLDAEDGAVALRLGTSIVSQKLPQRYPEAIYYLARAMGQMKPGADRDALDQYLRRVYTSWHGDLTEFDVTVAAATVAKKLPADWSIPGAAEVAIQLELAAKAWEESHPELALWRKLRIQLTGPAAAEYFTTVLKDAQLPQLKGTVTSTAAKEVVLAMDGANPEVTLRLDGILRERPSPGAVIAFSGIPLSFRQEPYMLVFEVKVADLKLNP